MCGGEVMWYWKANFVHAKQTLYQLSYISSPTRFLSKKKNPKVSFTGIFTQTFKLTD